MKVVARESHFESIFLIIFRKMGQNGFFAVDFSFLDNLLGEYVYLAF